METARNNIWATIWMRRKAVMAILLVISLVAGSVFTFTASSLLKDAIENAKRNRDREDTASKVREEDPLAALDDDTDDSGCMHVFDEPWVGLECKISDYNSEYVPGDEIRLKISFSKAVPNQVSTVVGGEWTTYQGTEKVFEKTFVPDMDYLLIQVTDLLRYKTVGLESVEVIITKKAAVSTIPIHSRRNYTRRGHYLLYAGDYNGTYATDDLWLSYCDDTDYLTLVYDCNMAEQTEWSVLGWGGSLNENWIGGPTYATSPRSGTEEVTVQFTVRFLRRMMGLGSGDQLAYMALGAWNGGRIKSLTLHKGYQMERSPELYTGGEANESWRCTDIEQILDAPDDSYLYVRYTCTGAKVPNAYVLGWGAGVNGGWITGRGYKIEGLAAGREYTVAMRMDEFRRSLGLSWDAKIDSLILSAYNNGKILAVWISPVLLESGKGNRAGNGGGAQEVNVSYGGGGGKGNRKPVVSQDAPYVPGIIYETVGEYYETEDTERYDEIINFAKNQNNVVSVPQDKKQFKNYVDEYNNVNVWWCPVSLLDSIRTELETNKDGFLVVEYSDYSDGDKKPVFMFGFWDKEHTAADKNDMEYWELYNNSRPWGTVSPVYMRSKPDDNNPDEKLYYAVYSYESIRRAIYGQGEIANIDSDNFQIQFTTEQTKPVNIYYVSEDDLEQEGILSAAPPIAEMKERNCYEATFTRYNKDAHPDYANKIRVTVSFDTEVEARLWLVNKDDSGKEIGGEGKLGLNKKEEGKYTYEWAGEMPDIDYLCIMVDKVLSGEKAKILDIKVNVEEKKWNGKGPYPGSYVILRDYQGKSEWLTGDVAFHFINAGKDKGIDIDGMSVEVRIAGETYYERISSGEVKLTNIPLHIPDPNADPNAVDDEIYIKGIGYDYVGLKEKEIEVGNVKEVKVGSIKKVWHKESRRNDALELLNNSDLTGISGTKKITCLLYDAKGNPLTKGKEVELCYINEKIDSSTVGENGEVSFIVNKNLENSDKGNLSLKINWDDFESNTIVGVDLKVEPYPETSSKNRSLKIDLSDYETGRKAKVSLALDEEKHAAEEVELEFKAGNEGTAVTDGDGKAVLNVVVPEKEMEIIVPEGRKIELKDISVEMMSPGYGTIEKNKPLSVDLAEIIDDSGHDYEVGANAEITGRFDDGWGNPVKDPGITCSLGGDDISVRAEADAAIMDMELPEKNVTDLSLNASGLQEGESIRLVSVSAEVEETEKQEAEAEETLTGIEFTEAYGKQLYPLENTTDLTRAAEVTLYLKDAWGNAAEGVCVQVAAGTEDIAGETSEAVTDADGRVVLRVELPQTEGDKMYLHICICGADMEKYGKIIVSVEALVLDETPSEEGAAPDAEKSPEEELPPEEVIPPEAQIPSGEETSPDDETKEDLDPDREGADTSTEGDEGGETDGDQTQDDQTITGDSEGNIPEEGSETETPTENGEGENSEESTDDQSSEDEEESSEGEGDNSCQIPDTPPEADAVEVTVKEEYFIQ